MGGFLTRAGLLDKAGQLGLTEQLETGKDYTFRFRAEASVFIPAPSEGTVANDLQRAHSFLNNVRVSRGLLSNEWYVQFEWRGLSIRVSQVASEMTEILNAQRFGVWEFLSAHRGRISAAFDVSTPPGSEREESGLPIPKPPSLNSFLIGVGIVLVLGALAFSFGRGVAGRV